MAHQLQKRRGVCLEAGVGMKSVTKALATATAYPTKLTPLSTSLFSDISVDFLNRIPSVDDCNAMSATELHKYLRASLIGHIFCHDAAKNLVVSAKLKMQSGEPIGGCTKFTGIGGYIDLHLKRDGQSYEAAERAVYRLLNGVGIDVKYDSSEYRAANKKAREEKEATLAKKREFKEAKSELDEKAAKAKVLKDKKNAEVVEESLDKLLAYILKNTTSDGSASVAAVKEIHSLAKKISLRFAA